MLYPCVFSFNLLRMHKEELERKHQHLVHILDTERGTRNQYMNQCEEQADEIAKLRTEVRFLQIISSVLSFCLGRVTESVFAALEENS